MATVITTSDQNAVRALAQFAEQRSTLAPDLPTAREQGFDVLMSSERGLAARCDVPEADRARLAQAIETALANPEFQEKAKQQQLPLSYLSGADWTAQMPARLDRFREILAMVKEGQ